MAASINTCDELKAEINRLRLRLQETEDTLRAIGNGEVDVFVLPGSDGDQIFSLKGAEHQYRILVETMSEGAATLTLDSTIIYCNQRLADMLLIPLEKLIGTKLSSYITTGDQGLFEGMLGKYAHEIEAVEYTLLAATGKPLPILISCSPYDLAGIHGVGVLLTDLTAQKLAVEAMRDSEEKYSVLFNDARDALITFSLQTSNFKNANNAAMKMFGAVSKDEFLAKTPWGISPEFQPCGLPSEVKTKEMIGIALRDGYHIFEWQHKRVDGETFPAEVLLSCLHIKDETLLMGTIRDNTEKIATEKAKRILEQQLQQAQKMEAIGNLAGGVAHDFNNKLMVIMGYVTLAQMNIDDSANVLKYLEQINLAAEHSRDITARLLTFSRRQVIDSQILNPNNVIAEALMSLSRLIGEHISITFVPDDNLWNVQIDPVQLDQIVMNMAVNARDAMPEGGTFAIESKNVTYPISCSSNIECVPGDYVRITFSDSGCGMDQDTLSHIFEPFFTTKEVGKGTGLGLATIYGIVSQNDGFIDADSTPGSGTYFKVYLPRHEAPAAELIKSDNVICAGSASILLVEDEEEVRLLIARFLRKIGYSVCDTESPRKALELASDLSIQIDLILTDVVMPEMNGIVMMEQIQKIRPGIRCIYASGYSTDHEYLSEASKAGSNFMQKPYDLIKLSRYLNRAINNNQEA